MSSIHASVRCPTCHGTGDGEPFRGIRYGSGYYEWIVQACSNCKGSGCRFCDIHYRNTKDERSAVIAIITPNTHGTLYLCLQCHGEEMAEQARDRAEARLTKQLEKSK